MILERYVKVPGVLRKMLLEFQLLFLFVMWVCVGLALSLLSVSQGLCRVYKSSTSGFGRFVVRLAKGPLGL